MDDQILCGSHMQKVISDEYLSIKIHCEIQDQQMYGDGIMNGILHHDFGQMIQRHER